MAVMNQEPNRRLYRSRNNRVFAGVAAGIGEYLNIDPTLVRVLMFLGLLFTTGPFGVVVYVILALIIPNAPAL